MVRQGSDEGSATTTIPLTKRTRDRLRALGRKGESYDALLNRLMDANEGVVEFERVE